jgi:hypothetical protein
MIPAIRIAILLRSVVLLRELIVAQKVFSYNHEQKRKRPAEMAGTRKGLP